MKNNSTQLTFRQNEDLQFQTRMKTWTDKIGITGAKIVFCITILLSVNVESNGQSITFAENDVNQTPMKTTVTGNMLTNDCDPINDEQWIKSATIFSGLNNQHPGQIGGRPFPICAENGITAGMISIYADGKYEFIPAPDFKGKVPIEYVVENASGATDAATLVIQVISKDNPIRNDIPIANNDTNTTGMGINVSGNVITSSDYDIENDELTISGGFADVDGDGLMEESLTVGTGMIVYGKNTAGTPMMAGVITLNTDGNYDFDPVADFSGKLSIEYKVTDGKHRVKANLTILVPPNASNQGCANDDMVIGKMSVIQSGNVLANDQESSVTQTIIEANNNREVALIIDGTTENELRSSGSLILDVDGSFTYSPRSGFIGTESISYVSCEGTICDTATLYLTTIPFDGIGAGGIGTIGTINTPSFGTLPGGSLPGNSLPGSDPDISMGNINAATDIFSVYPNPGMVGDDFINLRFKSLTGKTQIQITDLTGRLIKRLIVDANISEMNNLQVDVANLMEGRYHLQLIDGANTYSETFVLINKN